MSLKEVDFLFPLYFDPQQVDRQAAFAAVEMRIPNLADDFLSALAAKLARRRSKVDGLPEGVTPEDVLGYAYGVFYCPEYRKRCAEPLRREFPRLPLTADGEIFASVARLGRRLVSLHLLEADDVDTRQTEFPIQGNNVVEVVRFDATEGRVWINTVQYFGGIAAEVWALSVGGYKVLEQWLKDRVNRTLTYEEIQHFQRVVGALAETLQIIGELDATITSWPLT
jgi:hypothetical protein